MCQNNNIKPDGPKTKIPEYGTVIQEVHKLDEAVALTRFGRFNIVVIFVSGLILTTVLLETLGISFVLPIATCDLKLDNKQRGALGAVAFGGIISSSHLWGFLADTRGRRRMIYPALFIAFTCSFISSLLNNFYLLLIARFLVGFFVSAGSATIYAYLGEFHSEKNRSRAIMGASTVFGMGCVLLPVLAWACLNANWSFHVPIIDIDYKPWRFYMVVCGLPTLISAIFMFRFPESPKFVYSEGKHDLAVSILARVYAANSGCDASKYPVKKIVDEAEISKVKKTVSTLKHNNNKSVTKLLRKMWDQTVPLFRPPYWKRTLVVCMLQFSIFVPSNGMYMIFPDILNRISMYQEDNPGKQVGLCEVVEATSVVGHNATNITANECVQNLSLSTFEQSLALEIVYAAGFALIGLIINKVGKLSILVFVMFVTGVAGILAVYIYNLQWATAMYMIFLCCGFGMAIVNAATIDLYPTKFRAMAVCIVLMSGRLGSFLGTFVAGTFVEINCTGTFIGTSCLLLVNAFIAFFIPSISREPKTKEPATTSSEEQLPDF